MKASENRRNNSEIRARVKEVLDAREKAHAEALALIKEAYKIMSSTPYQGIDDDIYARGLDAVASAHYWLAGDSGWVGSKSETYIGNMAAFELGEEIEKDIKNDYV